MVLSRSVDYGLRALIYLAERERDTPVRLEEIAQQKNVPPTLLSKILQTLVKAGILRSQKGYRGGFVLTADPAELTLDEVVQRIDGPFTVFECLVDESFCSFCTGCKLRVKFQELQDAMREVLAGTTIRDLVADGAPSPLVAPESTSASGRTRRPLPDAGPPRA